MLYNLVGKNLAKLVAAIAIFIYVTIYNVSIIKIIAENWIKGAGFCTKSHIHM